MYEAPRFSPDGREIAVGIDTPKGSDVWIYDVAGSIPPRQLTFGGRNRFPIWSPDGTRVAFQSASDGDQAIWWQPADGGAPAERLTKPARGEEHVPDGFFPKGDRIMLSLRAAGRVSLWTYTLGDQKITPYIENQFSVLPHAAVSPDGLWVAYGVSAAQGDRASSAVFVQPFPATRAIYSIPIVLGVNPFWSPDGKYIYAATPSATAFSVVGVTTRPGFSVTTQPRQVQRPIPIGGGAQQPNQYAIAPDGEHFVIVVPSIPSDAVSRPRIDVVLNWHEELKRLAPAR
jgi:Tol biopolymer transport system component